MGEDDYYREGELFGHHYRRREQTFGFPVSALALW